MWLWRRLLSRQTPAGERQAARPRLEALEDRCVPTVTYGGGDLLTHVHAQAVFYGASWSASAVQPAQVNTFLGYLVNSPFTQALTKAGYGVGGGTALAPVTDGSTLGGTVSDAAIQAELQGLISAGTAAQPDGGQLYVVYVQPGTVVTHAGATSAPQSSSNPNSFSGYHAAFMGQTAGGQTEPIAYAVIAYPGGVNASLASTTALQDLTVVTSHEVAEGITDPNAGYFGRVGWYDYSYVRTRYGLREVTQELADVTSNTRATLNGYLVQEIAGQNDQPLALTGFTNLATTAVSISGPTTVSIGTPWTATIQVTSGTSGNLSGTVTLLDGDTVLGYARVGANGVATVTLQTGNALPGAHVVTAVFDGNGTFGSSFSVPLTLTFG